MHKAVLSIFISENKVFIVSICGCVECLKENIINKVVIVCLRGSAAVCPLVDACANYNSYMMSFYHTIKNVNFTADELRLCYS